MAKMHQSSWKVTASFGRKPPANVRWGTLNYDGIPLALAVTEEGTIARLEFRRERTVETVLATWQKQWPKTNFTRDAKAIEPAAKKILAGGQLNVAMVGTEFQCDVWKNLLRIPVGEVVSYAELARRIKRPRAVRAVGTACGANPVPILVPCHRVLGSDGGLGGFGGGLPVKRKLLKAEGVGVVGR